MKEMKVVMICAMSLFWHLWRI